MGGSKSKKLLCQGCDYSFAGPNCDPNTQGSCSDAVFAEAEPSHFHDQKLIGATKKIKQILAAIPKDPKGRNLALLGTHRGFLLAWVRHGGATPGDVYASKASKAKLERALRLKARK